jgi:membrane-associated protein
MSMPGPIDFILHINTHLQTIIAEYGTTTYAIVGAIIFCETGLVVAPFLPGDSLLFAVGTFAAIGSLNLWVLLAVVFSAAVIGDSVNYAVGKFLGETLLTRSTLIKPAHIEKTHAFYEKHGPKAVVLARFVPIVRTLAPFVAGIGKMNYATFMAFNVAGAAAWSGICVFAGYFLGTIPFFQKRFELVVIAIIVVSVVPIAIAYFNERRAAKAAVAG